MVARYSYWMAQVIAVGGEAVAAGVYMTFWFPGTPVWLWSLGFALVLLYFNSRSVNNFGSIEYWLALIKVVAIVIFIILGVATIFGIWTKPVGLHNLTGLPGGFTPHGFGGVWMAVIIGVFSFNGIEVIAVTSGEAKDPVRTIPAALRTMALRLFLFYILALTIVVTFVPWTETGAAIVTQSPFVRVFAHSGIRNAAGIMNFVVLSAALSSMRWVRTAVLRSARQERRADHRHSSLRRLHSDCRRRLEADPARVQLFIRNRAVRWDDRVDHHPAQPLKLPAQARHGESAGAHALVPRDPICRVGVIVRGAGDHGPR
jgi:L-asparagine transporter-like permease